MFVDIIIIISKIVLVLIVLLTGVAYSVYAERRVSAFIQDRYGPNRVGSEGLLQPIADWHLKKILYLQMLQNLFIRWPQ